MDTKYNKAELRIHQLGKMRKYIDGDIAITIYKQMILPLFDYADFMVESASKQKIANLEKLQEKALRYVDNDSHSVKDISVLYQLYNVQTLALRYREHLSSLMYRYSKKHENLDCRRPTMNLRSSNKVKFRKKGKRKYELYLKSPKVRGVKVWEMLPSNVQKATTKVKFKNFMKSICKIR